jgi:hypothetical protein
MTLIRSIYRQSLRHSAFICVFCIVFGIGFILIFFHRDDEKVLSDLNEYDDKITFWSNDFHIR